MKGMIEFLVASIAFVRNIRHSTRLVVDMHIDIEQAQTCEPTA